jgi:hypothetical protein
VVIAKHFVVEITAKARCVLKPYLKKALIIHYSIGIGIGIGIIGIGIMHHWANDIGIVGIGIGGHH